MTIWIKADGKTEIKLNDEPATVKKAESLGWTRKSEESEKAESKTKGK